MPSLTDAYQYVIDACNWPYVGYSQDSNLRRTIDITASYVTYCDCSSLMSKALTVGGYFHNNPWFSTEDEVSRLLSIGWEEKPLSGPWLEGDILWLRRGKSGHTEMVYRHGNGTGITMGAHGVRGKTFPNQVSINSSDSTTQWMKLFRDPTQSVTEYKWYQSNTYLPDYGEKMNSNAHMVFQYFYALGFTPAAIAGILGNFQWESRINPGMWENLDSSDPDNGYGLMQSTPSTKYRVDYAGPHNINLNDPDENGDGQCAYVNEGETLREWLPGSGYNYTWAEFSQLTDYEEATKAFMYQYERPNPLHYHLAERIEFAEHWYNLFKDGYWGGPDEGDPSGDDLTLRNLISDLQRRLIIPGRH